MVIRRASQPLSQGDHNLRPVPIVEEVMHVCHHAASLDFAVAREGLRARLRRGLLLIARSHASGNRRGASPAISTWMKRRAKFIVLSLYLRRMAGLLLKDGQTPLKDRKAALNVHLTENAVSAVGAAICRADAPGEDRRCSLHEDASDDVARVLEVLLAIMEIAREVSGFAADGSGEVRLSGQHFPEQRGWGWLFLLMVSA